jgi:hypothetical protein
MPLNKNKSNKLKKNYKKTRKAQRGGGPKMPSGEPAGEQKTKIPGGPAGGPTIKPPGGPAGGPPGPQKFQRVNSSGTQYLLATSRSRNSTGAPVTSYSQPEVPERTYLPNLGRSSSTEKTNSPIAPAIRQVLNRGTEGQGRRYNSRGRTDNESVA